MANSPANPSADVWLLLDDRPGHATQVRGLADRLGLEAREIGLDFNALNRLPSPLLGATRATVLGTGAAELAPPWPKLVIGMGRRVAPVARWIKRQSGGRSAVVLLGRKAIANEAGIDIAVTCAHFNPVPQANMVELAVPPTQVTPQRLARIAAERDNPMPELNEPRAVLLLGGPTAQHELGPQLVHDMATGLRTAVAETGGGLAVVTSRRTPAAAVEAIRAAMPEAHIHEWRRERKDNPFLAYLAHADLLAVTGESESMIAEAAASGKPLTILPLTPKPVSSKLRLAGWLRRRAGESGVTGWLAGKLLAGGWITPPRDLGVMHRRLVETGRARLFDGHLNRTPPRPDDELDGLTARIRALIA